MAAASELDETNGEDRGAQECTCTPRTNARVLSEFLHTLFHFGHSIYSYFKSVIHLHVYKVRAS